MAERHGETPEEPAPDGARRPYVAPRVIWSEDYQPASFGISCAKQPGNPGCSPGPASS